VGKVLAFPTLFYFYFGMSPVDICNIALAHIGDRRITRMDADAQAQDALVRYCVEFYELAKTQALAAHRWSFAKEAAELVQQSNPVIVGNYAYSHVLPTDLLRLLTVYYGKLNADDVYVYANEVDHFKKVGRKLWSNTPQIAIEYIANVDDPKQWSPHFQAAVARLLAHYLAGSIADNPQMANTHLEIYEKNALPNAQFYDSVQDNSGENDDLNTLRADSKLFRSHRTLGTGRHGR
jgi:hypothetical protein